MNYQISNKQLDTITYILFLAYENILDTDKRDYLLIKVNKMLEGYEKISSLALKKALDELDKMGFSNINIDLDQPKEDKLKVIVLAIYAINIFINTKENDFTFELSLELLRDNVKKISPEIIKEVEIEASIRAIFSKMV
jgi:molybdenum cofactor biosynthesis enzyme MoaA